MDSHISPELTQDFITCKKLAVNQLPQRLNKSENLEKILLVLVPELSCLHSKLARVTSDV